MACNGVYIEDMQTGEVLLNESMSAQLTSSILEHLKKFDVIPLVADGTYMYTSDVFNGILKLKEDNGETRNFNVIQYESRSNEYLLCEKKDMAEFFRDRPEPKILVAGQPEVLQEVTEDMAAPFKESTSNGFTAPFYYEYNPKGVNKARAIENVFTGLGIQPEEMMAFGDQMNDIPTLKYVRYGIAMVNAVEEAKQAAFAVTADNDHDGIAEAVYRYIPELK